MVVKTEIIYTWSVSIGIKTVNKDSVFAFREKQTRYMHSDENAVIN